MTTQKAIEGCRNKDRIAQKYLFDRWSEHMLMLCNRYVHNLHDAEEMMLNGFFNFFRSIDKYQHTGDDSLCAWLKKIMVNECLMFLRKKGTLKIVEEQNANYVADEVHIESKLAAAEMYKLIVSLPVGYRTVFNLYVVEGFTHKQIAELLGISEGASKSQLSKARESLKKALSVQQENKR
jgi:RNA polymerase sigma-70 factor (ECF subfamily)